jgi:hypothetical protein
MSSPVLRFFGQFLVHHREVSARQLDEALALMAGHNRRLGALAIEAGFIDEPTARRVWVMQRDADRPFGEILVSEGLVTADQLQDLLRRQHSRHVRIGEALERLGYMDVDRKSRLLAEYHLQLTRNKQQASESVEDPFFRFVVDTIPRLLPRVAGKPVALAQRPWAIGPREFAVRTSMSFGPGEDIVVGLATDPLQAHSLARGVLGVPRTRLGNKQISGAWRVVLELLARQATSQGRAEVPVGPTRSGLPAGGIAFDLITPDGSGALVMSRA